MKARVPNDRTAKVRAWAYCRNPQCRERSDQEFRFPVEHADIECPKCGADRAPMVGLYTLTHLLIPIIDGPILGAGGRRYALACDADRAYIATHTNEEAATGDIQFVNCDQCLENAKKLSIPRPQWTFNGAPGMELQKENEQ